MKILFVDHTTHIKCLEDFKLKARGGMVTSLGKVSDGLSKNHEVFVWAKGFNAESEAGVKWISDPIDDADIIVFNRGMDNGHPELGKGKRILWAHDLPHIGFCPDPKTMNSLSGLVSMSQYADRVWRDMFEYKGKSFLIPNGVDFNLFNPAHEKDHGYLIYASAPNRGLWRLPLIFDAIKGRAKISSVRMTAFSNMRTMHPGEIKETEDNYELDYSTCEEVGIIRKDPIPQKELAIELGRASMMLLPTNYPEICSNLVLQSLACGTPVITTGKIGSIPEWLTHRKNSMLTNYAPRDYMVYQKEIILNTCEVLGNTRLWKKLRRGAEKTRNKILSWEDVVGRWERMVNRFS